MQQNDNIMKLSSPVLGQFDQKGPVERIIFKPENGYMYIFVNDNAGLADKQVVNNPRFRGIQ